MDKSGKGLITLNDWLDYANKHIIEKVTAFYCLLNTISETYLPWFDFSWNKNNYFLKTRLKSGSFL
jgi:hypothetical protein